MTHEIFTSEGCHLKRCEVAAGYGCSLHTHKNKTNAFVVQVGRVIIETSEMPWLLTPGTSVIIKPGVPHRFVALTDATMYEVYYCDYGTKVDPEDIERQTKSGKVTDDDLAILSGKCEAV